MNDYEKCDDSAPRTTINLSCRRCGNTKREQNKPGLCIWCEAVVDPDPAREAEIDRRIHNMKCIHEIERDMTDLQLREWVMQGRYILDRDDKTFSFDMGSK